MELFRRKRVTDDNLERFEEDSLFQSARFLLRRRGGCKELEPFRKGVVAFGASGWEASCHAGSVPIFPATRIQNSGSALIAYVMWSLS